jgi:flagellar biosynthetic protein FlhB
VASHEDRTEQPTQRRREEARKRGQVARSPDLASAVTFTVCLYVLRAALSFSGRTIAGLISSSMGYMSSLGAVDLTEAEAHTLFVNGMGTVLLAAAPVALAAAAAGMGANLAQVGLLTTPQALAPQLSRIDPIAGLGRLFSKQALLEMLKAVAKVAAIGYFAYHALRARAPSMLMMAYMDLGEGLRTAGDAAMYVAGRTVIPLVAIGAADYVIRRRQLERELRMTKQEVKEELKQQEGDPLVRSRIRQRQRQLAMRRMMEDVKLADVVVTNPTHYAVALKYDREKMRAPHVVAKGQRIVAQRIREIAAQAGVPVVENPLVAQALFKSVEVGQEIPPDLYRAVAQILAFVYKLGAQRERRE